MSGAAGEHERLAAAQTPVRCAVLTVSDTRRGDADHSGPTAARLLAAAGHETVARAQVPDEPEAIRDQLVRWLDEPQIQAIITTGGTGVARRDRTIEVVRGLLTIELEGFGELFRMLSYRQVGAAAMLSRAVGGIAAAVAGPDGGDEPRPDTLLFALPGSPAAVELAVAELIAPQLPHLAWLRRR